MEPIGLILLSLLIWGAISGWLLRNSHSENSHLKKLYADLWEQHQRTIERLSPEYRNMLVSAKEISERIVTEAKHQAQCLRTSTETELQTSRRELDKNKRESENYRRQHCLDTQAYGARLKAVEDVIQRPPASISLSWLSDQYAEFADWSLKEVEDKLQWWNRAHRASEIVSMVRQQTRQAVKQLRAYKARARYYETMFPFLCDLVEDDGCIIPQEAMLTEHASNNADDPVGRWLTPAEYERMSEIDRNQLALDRYNRRNKTNWEIGRDYEAFIGYTYSQRDYAVEYFGMREGLQDLGRDLICKSGMETLVVQCKRWAQCTTIHEKHINQLVGTTIEYAHKTGGTIRLGKHTIRFGDNLFEHPIRAVFVTTTHLSDTAKQFAECLGVEVREGELAGEYPMIKCNISRHDGRKIYHLPFDEQYDTTIIEPEKGEFFACTVKEAADKGFIRAGRHFLFGASA